MSDLSDIKKIFEGSLLQIDRLIEIMKTERDRLRTEFERRLELIRFGRVDWSRFEEFFEEP